MFEEVCTSLLAIIIRQQQQIEELNEKLSLSSNNSSLAPSNDFKKRKKKKKNNASKHTGRKQGAQPGHKGINRAMAESEKVNCFIACYFEQQCSCGNELVVDKKNYISQQVYDIDDNKHIILTEYRLYKTICEKCSKRHKGILPAEVDNTIVGNKLKALISIMVGEFHLSKAKIKRFLEIVYNLKISTGTISNTEARVSKALEQTYQDISNKLKQEKTIHCDETRHYQNNQTNWAWVGTNENITVFMLDKSRGKKSCRKLIGNNYAGVIISDRYCAYNIIDDAQRQFCWAHLKRDFTCISQRSGIAGRVGDELLVCQNKIFKLWHSYKASEISYKKLAIAIKPIQRNIELSLEKGVNSSHSKTANTCKNILKSFSALWRFTEAPGVEPTNNLAERQIRPYVIYRKLSFGTQSNRGTRYIERLMTVIASCKQQSRNILRFISQAIINYNKATAPPLLYAPEI